MEEKFSGCSGQNGRKGFYHSLFKHFKTRVDFSEKKPQKIYTDRRHKTDQISRTRHSFGMCCLSVCLLFMVSSLFKSENS